MKRIFQLLCGAAIITMTGTVASDVHAYALFAYPLRALFAYPLKGQTLDQVNVDRAACHDWAVSGRLYWPCPAAEPIGINVSASEFAEQINKTFRDFSAGGAAMDRGCNTEQGVAVCKFIVSTPGSSLPGAAFAASENAPVERIRILSSKVTDHVNFTLVMGAVMAITESDMSRDERGKMALDLMKRFGSKNPEVSGTLGTYRLDSVDGGGTMLEAQRRQ
jgi:hypothetical protein